MSSPNPRAELLLQLADYFTATYDSMNDFSRNVCDKIRDYLNVHEDLYKETSQIWLLFSDFSKFTLAFRPMMREVQDNSKGDNLYGPLNFWPSMTSTVLSYYLTFYHNYSVYSGEIMSVINSDHEFHDFIEEIEKSIGYKIFDFFQKRIKIPNEILSIVKRLAELVKGNPESPDRQKLFQVVDEIGSAIQKAQASTVDGVPYSCNGYLFAQLNESPLFGKNCEAMKTEEDLDCRYKARVISKTSQNSHNYMEQILNEIDAANNLKHANILRVIETFEDELFYYIIFPFTEEMELSAIILRGGKLPEEAARPIFRQLIHAIQYIHSRSFIHAQICPSKILFFNNRVRLFDFSQCHIAKPTDRLGVTRPPLAYCPPEALKPGYYNGAAADLWGAGAVLFEMLTGRPLFSAKSEAALERKVARAAITFPKEFSPPLIAMMKGILNPIPSERLSIEQILSHPWMRKTLEVTIKNTIIATPPASPSVSPLATRPVSPWA